MKDESVIKQFERERKETLASLDPVRYRAHHDKWHKLGLYNYPILMDDIEIERMMCKEVVKMAGIPTSRKEEARDWLRHNGEA